MEGLHAVAHRDLFEFGGFSLLVDGFDEFLVAHHQFVDADAAFIAAAAALGAAFGVGFEDGAVPADRFLDDRALAAFGDVGDAAGFADAAQEALGADAEER